MTESPSKKKRAVMDASESLPGVFHVKEPHEYMLVLRGKEVRGLFGNVLVRAIIGNVRIDGGLVRESDKSDSAWHNVCAPVMNGRPIYISIDIAQTPASLNDHRVRRKITDLSTESDAIIDFVSRAGDIPFAVLLISKKPTVETRIVQSLHDSYLAPVQTGNTRYSYHFTTSVYNMLLPDTTAQHSYSDESRAIIDRTIDELLAYEGTDRVSVLLTGNKGVGKSTFSRKLVNFLWGLYKRTIYYMDLDIGQSEFTPPGIISCTKITKPILDCPFNHQQAHFENAYFVGNVTVRGDDEKRYLAAFDALYDRYLEESPSSSTLIINTMGWTTSFGKTVLDYVCQKVYPRYMVRLTGSQEISSSFTYQLPYALASNVRQVTIEWRRGQVRSEAPLSAANLRELSTITYFAKCLPESRPVLSAMVEIVPFEIDFSALCIILPPAYRSLPDKAVFAALNLTVVSLCALAETHLDKKTRRRMLGSTLLPWLVASTLTTPAIRVHGYGIIRGVEMEKRKLFVLTPLSSEQMNEVDSIACIKGVPLPYPIMEAQAHPNKPYALPPLDKKTHGIHKELYAPFVNRTAFNTIRRKF